MNREQLVQVIKDGPQNVQQRSVLLTLCGLSKEDCTVSIGTRALLCLIDIPTRNMTFTLNELIKKGWIEVLTEGTYRIDPAAGVRASVDETYMDTNNWGSGPPLL